MICITLEFRRLSMLVMRIPALLAARRDEFLTVFMWCSLAAVLILPALSQVGYPVWSLEYVLAALTSIIAGLFFHFAAKLKPVEPRLLVILTTVTFLLYFGAPLRNIFWFGVAVAALAAFMYFASSKPKQALRICAVTALAQIAVTALTVPEAAVVLVKKEAPRKDVPSVIHVLLDEHAGISAFPESAVDRADARRLEEIYLQQGFTVFRRAYSAHEDTPSSLALLFNLTDGHLPPDKTSGESTSLLKATLLEQISEQRTVDLTYTSYVDMKPAVKKLRNVVGLRRYPSHGSVTDPEIGRMSVSDRLWLMAASVMGWLTESIKSPLTTSLIRMTEPGRHWYGLLRPAGRTSPLTGQSVLRDLSKRLECCGERGSYVFAHLIYPHHPYVFDKTCKVLPTRLWLNPVAFPPSERDTLAARKERWRRHFEQAYCAAMDVAQLAGALRRRKDLADAVIIIHGDHGARIGRRNYARRGSAGYDETAGAVSYRGTFFAVRIPGVLERGVVDTPVRIDDLFRRLVENDFRSLDLKALQPRADSPYRDWRRE